jgi:hypothetical protein
MQKDGGTWTGFLTMAFAVVGLIGCFGTYAAQIPFDRALARAATLDEVLQAAAMPDATARLDALRPALGDSAGILTGPATGLPARIAAERARMFSAFGRESADIGFRLRIVIAVFAAAGALFGAAVLSIARRAPAITPSVAP